MQCIHETITSVDINELTVVLNSLSNRPEFCLMAEGRLLGIYFDGELLKQFIYFQKYIYMFMTVVLNLFSLHIRVYDSGSQPFFFKYPLAERNYPKCIA
jgi:hypothetical protein